MRGQLPLNNHRIALLYNGIARYRGAVELGWYDLVTRFRPSYFGPLWATIQLALWIGALSLIFYGVLGEDLGKYVIYVGIGLYIWDFLSASIIEGPTHFTSQRKLIKNVPVDLSYLTVRKISFLTFRSLFQIPVPIFLILYFSNEINFKLLVFLVPVPFLLICFTYACLIIFGVIGAYLRDFAFLMQSVARFLFFTTPIIWRGDTGFRKIISNYNPFSYFLELVRAPIEGSVASPLAWAVVCSVSLGGICIAFWVQQQFRNRIIYWV